MKVFITSDAVPAPTGNHDTDRATYNALTWVEVGHIWCEAYSGRGWISPAIDLQGRTANAIRLCTYSKAGDGANYKTNSGPFEGNFNREPWNDRVQTVVNETLQQRLGGYLRKQYRHHRVENVRQLISKNAKVPGGVGITDRRLRPQGLKTQ